MCLKGYEQLLNESYQLIDFFVNELIKRPFIQIATEPDVNICCFRLKGTEKDINQLNYSLQQYLIKEEGIFFSLPTYRKDKWLRAVLLNPFTTIQSLENIIEKIDQFYNK